MADDNVSFTDAGDPTGAANQGDKGGSSAMLDLLGAINKKEEKQKDKKKKDKKGKKGKDKTKKVKHMDKYESQNFLFRIEGAIFCAAIIVGFIALMVLVVGAIIFAVITNGNLVSYMHPLWGNSDENAATH
uniref:Uncharacterized protein n=1 Tax=Caenorhabditis japonica TaxID=281687 RepID=A0A8R1HYJ6_CAEJA